MARSLSQGRTERRPDGFAAAWRALAPLTLISVLLASTAVSGPRASDWNLRSAATEAAAPTSAVVATDPAASSVPFVSAVHLAQTGDLTRLVFDLSGPVDVSAFVLGDPRRIIVDLPELSFRIDPESGRPAAGPKPAKGRNARAPVVKPLAGVIASYRFGLFAPGKSRIVVDLAETARIVRAEVETTPGAGSRLVLDLAKADAATFAKAAAAGEKVAASQSGEPRPGKTAAGDASLPIVVLDPGHGGIDAGAHGASDTQEKVLVFDFARSLAAHLEAQGRYRVLMTRTEDIFVPLSERVQIARNAGAALLISIHADTLSDAAGVSGATVYTVSDRASDAEAARLADKENKADLVAGLDSKEDASDVSDILFDLTRRETRAYSHVFARTLIGYFKESARLNKNPQRSAGFRVLKAPDVPSVLLELGYLSSERDLAQLRSPEWRETASKSVAKSIDAFFAARAPATPPRAAEDKPDGKDVLSAVAPAIH